MANKNLDQIYIANPITTNASTDLMYFMQSPYSSGTDAGMTYSNFAAQFGAPYTAAALTKTDDTNVTLTLGGTPATSLLQAVSITAGWSGTLSLARGGTAAALTASNGGIFYSTASAGAILSGTATANQMLQSGASGAPAWSTATYPATTTVSQILYSSSANVVGGITTANNGVLITSNSGVPSLLANSGTAGWVLTANSGAPPSWQAVAGGSSPFTAGTGTLSAKGGGAIDAAGANSFAWGPYNTAHNEGSYVISDNEGWENTDTGINQYVATFGGGFYFFGEGNSVAVTIDGGTGDLTGANNILVSTAGKGLRVKEGSNAKQGVVTLSSGIGVVSNTSVTANSRIFYCAQDTSTIGFLNITARSAGSGFTITSSVLTDSGVVAYEIFEPA